MLAGGTTIFNPNRVANVWLPNGAVDGEDINGTVSSSIYNDPLDRQTQIIIANNRPLLRSQITIAHDDTNRSITVTKDQNALDDNLLKSETLYDGL